MIYKMLGHVYSSKKVKWKKIIEKHGLKWKGNMNRFIWEGNENKLVMYCLRIADVTKEVVLYCEGKDDWKEGFEEYWKGTPQMEVLEEIPKWCDVQSGDIAEEERMKVLNPMEEFNKWLKRERHYVENLKTKWNYYGKVAPECFYKSAVKDFEERAKVKLDEISSNDIEEHSIIS